MPKVFNAANAKVGDVVLARDGSRVTVLAIGYGVDDAGHAVSVQIVVWGGKDHAPYVVDASGNFADNLSSGSDITHFAPVIETYWLCPNAVNSDRGQFFSTLEEALKLCPCPITVTREV